MEFRQDKKEENKQTIIEIENSEKSPENHLIKKEKCKEIRKWTGLEVKPKAANQIWLSPRISSISPKFSHQMLVKNPRKLSMPQKTHDFINILKFQSSPA